MQAIKDDLREIFLAVLKLESDDLEEAESFQDLGISSINIVQLVEAINRSYNLTLPTSILFECRNMDVLVNYIQKFAKGQGDLSEVSPIGADFSGGPGGGSGGPGGGSLPSGVSGVSPNTPLLLFCRRRRQKKGVQRTFQGEV